MFVSITIAKILEATIMYGLVHFVWLCLKWGTEHLETEAGKVIKEHVKAGHGVRLKHCLQGSCSKLETESSLLRQVEAQQEHY